MRIVHVAPSFYPAGAERVVANLAVASAERHEMHVVSLYPDVAGSLRREMEAAGVKTTALDKPKGPRVDAAWRLARRLRDLSPDVVHTHTLGLAYSCPAVWWLRPPACVHTVHTLAERENDGRYGRLYGWAFTKKLVTPVAVGEQVRRSIEERYGLSDVATIENGIPVARFLEPEVSRMEVRAREGIAPDAICIIHVAGFRPVKNHRTLLRAFSEVHRQQPRARLILVGDGAERPVVEREIHELGLASAVHVLGNRDDVADLLHASDVFTLPSLFEGLPMSAVEAMVAGLPVVASSVGGLVELVDGGRRGRLVEPGEDPEPLSRVLLEMVEDETLRTAAGREARTFAVERYGIAACAERYESLYRNLGAGDRCHEG